MAYGIIHKFENATEEQYRASVDAVHPEDGLPDGQLSHIAGPTESGGWTIVAVHESKESWERFRDEQLMPKLQAGIEGGFTGVPEESTFEITIEESA